MSNIRYGEKKTLMAFYSLNDYRLSSYSIINIDDIWYAYYDSKIVDGHRNVFELCSKILISLNDNFLFNRFLLNMRNFIEEDEIDSFLDNRDNDNISIAM